MTTHIAETDAEEAAHATAKAAYETIREAHRALYIAHANCCAPVPIPTMGGGHLQLSNSHDLFILSNGALLHTPNGLYVKHWKQWRGEYDKISHEEMWECILGAYTDGPLDGDFLLTPRSFVEPPACDSEADTERN